MVAWLYILRCADGAYYTGTTRAELEQRVAEHQSGHFGGFTAARRPVTLVFSEHFGTITDAITAERQIKGWSRAKKEALMAGDFQRVSELAKRRGPGKGPAGVNKNAPTGKVLIARFGAAHGVRGDIKLWSFTEDPLALLDYGPLETIDGARTFELESLRPQKDFLVARIDGVGDRNAAEALRNLELYVPRERLPQIEDEATWYISDLIGLAAQTADGTAVGVVTAVHNFGAGDVIELAPADGGASLMLAFTVATVPEVDVVAGRIVVMLPREADDVAGDRPDDLP